MSHKNQWQDTQKTWKAFPLRWELYAEYNNSDDEIKRLTPFQIGILLAAVYPYRWSTRWVELGITEDELDKQIAEIEDRLMSDEESGMATKEDIRDGMYEAMNRLALQIVTGQYAGVSLSTDEDGVVTPETGGTEDVELPEDDPLTLLFNETEMARMGGAMEAAALLENIIEKIDFLYGSVNGTPSYTAAQAETMMSQLWDWDAALLNAAITNYYAYRAANPRILYVKSAAFGQYLYCHGVSAQMAARYIIDFIGFTFIKQDAMLQFWFALLQSVIDAAYTLGITKPSTSYLDASCVRAQNETILIAAINPNYTTLTQWKVNHRLRITATGVFVDPTGIQRDFWYYRTAAGVVSSAISATTVTVGTAVVKPTTTQNPYNSSHVYQWTTETPLGSAMVLSVAPFGAFGAGGTGNISVLIEDLGEITT